MKPLFKSIIKVYPVILSLLFGLIALCGGDFSMGVFLVAYVVGLLSAPLVFLILWSFMRTIQHFRLSLYWLFLPALLFLWVRLYAVFMIPLNLIAEPKVSVWDLWGFEAMNLPPFVAVIASLFAYIKLESKPAQEP